MNLLYLLEKLIYYSTLSINVFYVKIIREALLVWYKTILCLGILGYRKFGNHCFKNCWSPSKEQNHFKYNYLDLKMFRE